MASDSWFSLLLNGCCFSPCLRSLSVEFVSFNVTPYQRRQPLAHFCASFAVVPDPGRRDRLLDERQIEDRRVAGQRHRFVFTENLKWRDILAERKTWTVHDHEVR